MRTPPRLGQAAGSAVSTAPYVATGGFKQRASPPGTTCAGGWYVICESDLVSLTWKESRICRLRARGVR